MSAKQACCVFIVSFFSGLAITGMYFGGRASATRYLALTYSHNVSLSGYYKAMINGALDVFPRGLHRCVAYVRRLTGSFLA